MNRGSWGLVGAMLLALAATRCEHPIGPNLPPIANATRLIAEGRRAFRYDTFGNESFWSGKLQLQDALMTLSPRGAMGLGLKVDVAALTPEQKEQIQSGAVDLDDPGITQELIDQDAILGVVGHADVSGSIQSIGLTCALCHSTVDDSLAPGVGNRIDGIANRDLNFGQILADAPELAAYANQVNKDADAVAEIVSAWGPGRVDLVFPLDGKFHDPDDNSSAVLIPSLLGLNGNNLNGWTVWGGMAYRIAFDAVLQLHGIGNFFDERLDNHEQFPMAAEHHLGHISIDAGQDRVSDKIPALEVYLLALPPLRPRPVVDFSPLAAGRGGRLFFGKACCAHCHLDGLWTDTGHNAHSPEEMKIGAFQADRSPGHAYRTSNLNGLFQKERGLYSTNPAHARRFYHDGRFKSLFDVVESYNDRFGLKLNRQEESDLVEYLKSL